MSCDRCGRAHDGEAVSCMLCAMLSFRDGSSVNIPVCEAHADAFERGTARHERARIVAWLKSWVVEQAAQAKGTPEGTAIHGGPFDGCPAYDLAMKEVRRVAWVVGMLENAEHLKVER